ncbi:MAG: hypothetical protein M3R17_10980 [Bacteroidota bacterium]|nr:hypothetical protein [Bacteroidota bacterium]
MIIPGTTGFVGINTTTPNQLLTIRGGNMNVTSPIGNTAYMLSSNAFPADRVLWHNGERTNIFVGVGAANASGNPLGLRTTVLGFNAANAALNADDGVFIGANAGLLNSGGDFNVFIGSDAGRNNINASRNVFIGALAGQQNVGGI